MAHVGVRPQTQPDSLPPAGRLKGHLDTWKVITSDPWVVTTIKGYRIDFLSEPHQRVRPHTPQYSVEQSQLIVKEIKELLGKGAIAEVHNPRGGFYSNSFLVPKKDGGQRPVINLKALNSFVQTEHFKMEGIHTLRPCQSGGLDGKGGSEGCVFRNPNPQITPSIPEISLSGEMVSVPVPTIWPVIGSLGLYQDPEASTSSPPGDGCATDIIHRRYPDPGGVPGASKEPCGGSGVPPAVPRFQSKPEKVGPRTSPSDGIPGLYSGHSPHGAEAPTGENKKDSCGVTIHGQRGPGVRQSPGQAGGQDECNISGDPTSPTILSAPTDGPVGHTQSALSVLRGYGPPDNRVQGGTDVVGHPHDKLEWKVPPQEGSGHDNRFRCLTDRLGSNQSEPKDRRSVVTDRVQDAHQLSGAASCNTSSQDIPEKQKQDVSAPQVGQYHGSGIHKQPGRDSLQGIGRLSEEPVDVVPGEEYPHHSPTPSRCSECDSRCGVSDYDRPVRLAAESGDIQQDIAHFRSHRSGHVCITSDSSVPSLFQLAARSLCSSNRCIPAGLVSDQGVCKPAVEPDRSGSVQNTDGQGSHCLGGTSLEDTAMVPPTTADASCNTMSDQSPSDNAEQRSGGPRPSTSRVAYLRERYRDQELSEEATSLMLKSWRTKTNKSYTHSLASGIAGVVQGVQIPFQAL